jgi:phage gp29-like protein
MSKRQRKQAEESIVAKLRMMPPDQVRSMIGRVQSTPSHVDVYSDRPGYGLTPERIFHVFRDAEQGMTRTQCNLFEDVLENDGHLQGHVNNRIETLAGKEWLVKPGDPLDEAAKKGAEVLGAAMRRANTFQLIEHQLQAFWIGWAASEPVWQFVDGWWVPIWFVNMPAQRFAFPYDSDELRLTSTLNPYPGEPLGAHWMVNMTRHRRLARGGAGRCATWWSCFKRMSVRDWIVFAEKFGIPIPIGVWNERAGDESRKVVEQAVIDIGEAGQAVMSELCKIVFADIPQRGGDASALHPSIVALCNAEISKLITGATLTSEAGGPGSFALGKVHENRGLALLVYDAMRLKNTFRQTVGRDFNRLNGLAGRPEPELELQVLPETDPLTRVKVASILAKELGMELDETQLRQEFKFRAPQSPESAVKATPTPSPAGPSDPSDPEPSDEE